MYIAIISVVFVAAVLAWYFGYHKGDNLTDIFSFGADTRGPAIVWVGTRLNVLRTTGGERARRMRARRSGRRYNTHVRRDLPAISKTRVFILGAN